MKIINIIFALIMSLIVSGCEILKANDDIEITAVNSWEGHFMTTNDFYKATKDINLKNGESIWILSNRTFKRVLKNIESK